MTAIASAIDHYSSDKFFQLNYNNRFFISKYPVLLHVCAKRVGEVPSLDNITIQQSMYLKIWKDNYKADEEKIVSKIKSFLRKQTFLYETAQNLYRLMGFGHDAKNFDIDKALKSFE